MLGLWEMRSTTSLLSLPGSFWPGNAGALGNAEYSFIAITPRSTLALSGGT